MLGWTVTWAFLVAVKPFLALEALVSEAGTSIGWFLMSGAVDAKEIVGDGLCWVSGDDMPCLGWEAGDSQVGVLVDVPCGRRQGIDQWVASVSVGHRGGEASEDGRLR